MNENVLLAHTSLIPYMLKLAILIKDNSALYRHSSSNCASVLVILLIACGQNFKKND